MTTNALDSSMALTGMSVRREFDASVNTYEAGYAAGYTATIVTREWAGVRMKKVYQAAKTPKK